MRKEEVYTSRGGTNKVDVLQGVKHKGIDWNMQKMHIFDALGKKFGIKHVHYFIFIGGVCSMW